MVELLLPFLFAFVLLFLVLRFAWQMVPGFVKQYLFRPLTRLLWNKPWSRGLLFSAWFFYLLFAGGLIVRLLSGTVTAKTLVLVLLLILPMFFGKALLNYRQRGG